LTQNSLETSLPREPASPIARLHQWGVQNPKYYYIAPPSVWAVAIYILSLAPIPESGLLGDTVRLPYVDKLGHMGVHAVLAMLVIRGWHREKMPPLDLHGFVWLLCGVFGMMIEMQQGLSPHRSFEAWDIAANGFGALLGLILWQILMWRWGRRTRLYPGLLRPEFKQPSAERRKSTDSP
jgi:VanZ family protein